MTEQPRGVRVFYRDIKPYEAPGRLEDLHGPGAGPLDLPLAVYWGPPHVFDLDARAEVIEAYQATVREGSAARQVQILNRHRLLEVWPDLLLPARARELWEGRFPELVSAR